MSGNIFLITPPKSEDFHAGTKYESDIQFIFKSCGAKVFQAEDLSWKNKLSKLFNGIRYSLKNYSKIRKNDKVFILYANGCWYIDALLILKKIFGFKIYIVIMDIDLLRFNNISKSRALRVFDSCCGIIAQNELQKKFLYQNNIKIHTECMNILDFIGTSKASLLPPSLPQEKTICFGANLAYDHSGFLYDWIKKNDVINYKVNVYGINLEQKLPDKFKYGGAFAPDESHLNISGHFGLVWVDDKCDSPGYYRYATPHKMSMYIMAGMPVIIHKDAASADYVEKNNIGILVSDIDEIDAVLSNITTERYKTMCQNVKCIQSIISDGMVIKNLLKSF